MTRRSSDNPSAFGASPDAEQVSAALARLGISRRPRLLSSPAFFADPHLARDVVRYPAAAIALAVLEPGCWRGRGDGSVKGTDETRVSRRRVTLAERLERMRAWRGLYSPAGESYRSLDRTLMNLPGSVPPRLVGELRHVRLERPVTTPLALSALCLRVRERRTDRDPEVEHSHLLAFQRASDIEVTHAVAWVAFRTDRRLEASRPRDLGVAVRYLADFPFAHRGSLLALAHAATSWHEAGLSGARLLTADELAIPTARPRIPLPTHAGVRFLDTVGAVVDEGARMGHCVAEYCALAARGEYFLFHVVHGATEATVAVSRDGRTVEAAGPGNQPTAASRAGRRILAWWARQLTRRRRAPTADALAVRTARPPVALPVQEGLRFLDSVGAVLEEEASMANGVEDHRASAARPGSTRAPELRTSSDM